MRSKNKRQGRVMRVLKNQGNVLLFCFKSDIFEHTGRLRAVNRVKLKAEGNDPKKWKRTISRT